MFAQAHVAEERVADSPKGKKEVPVLGSLNGNEGIVFLVIERWWKIIVYKWAKEGASSNSGRVCPRTAAPITKLTAADVQSDLLKYYNVSLSLKQIRTALDGLVEKHWTFRFKALAQKWEQDYSYMPMRHNLGKYNSKRVGLDEGGVRLTPTEWWDAQDKTDELIRQKQAREIEENDGYCPEGRYVPPSREVRPTSAGHIEVTYREVLNKELLVRSSSLAVIPASPEGRCANSEPTEPEPESEFEEPFREKPIKRQKVAPMDDQMWNLDAPFQQPVAKTTQTTPPVKDAEPVEQTEPPIGDEDSEAASNTFNDFEVVERAVGALKESLEVLEYDPASDVFLWEQFDSVRSVPEQARMAGFCERVFRTAMSILGLQPEVST